MLFLRSLLFNVAFYVFLVGLTLVGLPALFMDRYAVFRVARYWGAGTFWLMRVICGTKVEFRGVENIPKGACIIAPKHQSIWDVFAFLQFTDDFTYILKRELTWIPLFGWYLWRADQVAINRSTGAAALNEATSRAREILQRGRQLFIFPEGTRRPAGAPPKYKFGVAHIYGENNAPCLPVAHAAGLLWGRRLFLRRPGTIIVDFLPPIEPGLDKQVFFARLQSELEAATNRIVDETLARHPELASVLAASR